MFDPATLSAAFTSLKALLDLAKSANDGPLAIRISSEVANLQGKLIDVQQQSLALQSENQDLRAQISAFNDEREFRNSLRFDPAGIYRLKGREGEELYCSACLDHDNKRVRLAGGTAGKSPFCFVHGGRR